ncbi:MAG: RNA polymerase sigma factor [Pseudomonadota bacterium]
MAARGRNARHMADAEAGRDEDAVLLARFASGDQSAARALTDRLLPGALRQAWRMLGDQSEAEDVAQEAMLRLWRQASDWRAGEARISTWLYRVVHNLCIDRMRKRRPQVPVEDAPEPVDPDPSVLERMAASERSKAVAEAIAELPERQRQALVLRHFEGMSNPDIGEALECSVEAVESLLARARRQLAKRMSEQREALGHD